METLKATYYGTYSGCYNKRSGDFYQADKECEYPTDGIFIEGEGLEEMSLIEKRELCIKRS